MSEIINVFQNPKFIKLLAESIIKKDCPSFRFVQLESLGNGSYFVLYLAQSCGILLEIQSDITRISMKESIQKCLEVYDRFGITPSLVILCVDNISSSVSSSISPDLENPYRHMLNSTCWAKKCIIILKDTIDYIEDEQNLDPLVAFTIYFSNDKMKKQKLRDIGNPYIKDINDCR